MTKLFSKILSLTLTLLTIVSLCTGVGAEDKSQVIADTTIHFTSVNQAVEGDLFDNFKGVMPGDTRTQKITFVNDTGVDKLNLKLVGVPHDEDNQINDEVAETWAGYNDVLAAMNKFLSNMTLTIFEGDTTNGTPLVNEMSASEILEGIKLDDIAKGESVILTVVLKVSIDMGNEFQDRAGEIDWKFIAEGLSYNKIQVRKVWDDNNYPKRPTSVKVYLTKDGERTEEYVILSVANSWQAVFDELDDRYTWDVEEVTPSGYDEPQYIQGENGLITIKNHKDYTPYIPWYPTPDPKPDPKPDTPIETEPDETEPVETEPEETEPDETNPDETEPEEVIEPPVETPVVRDLTVHKTWAEDKADERPTSVTVALYNAENEIEKVVLGDWNNWSYTWYDLNSNEQWSVLEVDIPLGYTPSYAVEGDTITITNNAILIQTGQLNWPIFVFGGLGVLLVGGGVVLMCKKKHEDA